MINVPIFSQFTYQEYGVVDLPPNKWSLSVGKKHFYFQGNFEKLPFTKLIEDTELTINLS